MSIRDHDRRLSRDYEDWQVILGCSQGGVEGCISDDDGMLDNSRVIAVVEQLRMTLVVCVEINHDPIAATGLMFAGEASSLEPSADLEDPSDRAAS